MRALNMKEEDTQGQTKPMFHIHKNNLEDVMDNNIDDILFSRNNYLRLSKLSVPAL